MPDIWVLVPIAVSAAVILLLYTIPPPWVKRYMRALDDLDLQAMSTPEAIGQTLRHAYPPEDVAGMVNAVVEAQKPAVKQFVIDEGIPFLAAAGSSEVARNARGGKSELASAVGELGSGAAGLQGLVAAMAKPGKSSGIGDLVQYLPIIQQFMQSSQNSKNEQSTPYKPPGNGGGGGYIG